jgi:signal transduction histidine kinase/CheY-like chemotaxis protein
MRRLSLRARLLLLVVGLPFLVLAPLVVLLPERMERQSRAWATSRSLGVARPLAVAVTPAVDFDDREAAEVALRQLAAVDGATYAHVHRADGTVMASWGTPSSPAGWPVQGDAVAFEGGLIHVSVPLPKRFGPPASLEVGFGLSELAQRQEEIRWLALAGAAFLAVMGASLALAANRFIARPLARVTAVARRITAGDQEARDDLDLRRADEIGTLARAFDVMLRALQGQRRELEHRGEAARALNAHLEDRVAERTEALASANRELERRLAELKEAHDQLVVSERRAGVGQLAAGVAHEINNPLAYVTGNLSFVADLIGEARAALLRGEEEGRDQAMRALAELAPAVSDAAQGASRVHQIVRGLKAFSRGDEDVRTPVDVRAALSVAIDMALNEIKHRAVLLRDLAPLPRVEASEVRLTQVFLNLLVNAAQAIPAGNATRNTIEVSARVDEEGQVVVVVRDTGSGMSPAVKARLFEPFFTTKPTGQGTGLGLPISLGIVSSYGGTIDVESEPGRGSTFRVRLPPSARAPGPAATDAPVEPAGPRLRLLVVDDEASVGVALERLLARFHDVVPLSSAKTALERVRGGERFDRVLCDLEMPEMSGAAFWAALGQAAPALAARLIFMTGGAFTDASLRVMETERARVIEKPVDVVKLRRMLREA